MKKLIALFGWLILPVALAAAQSSPWVLYSWGKSGLFKPTPTYGSSNIISSFAFPAASVKRRPPYPAFLTTTTVSAVLGNLTGKTVTATFNVPVVDHPQFIYGGWFDGWNTCPNPANARFYFTTTSNAYNVNEGIQNKNAYWWSRPGTAVLSASTGTVTISDTIDPEHWTNANSGYAINHLSAWTNAIQHVAQIGLAFSGGCYDDIGVAVLSGTGSASFQLISFSVTP